MNTRTIPTRAPDTTSATPRPPMASVCWVAPLALLAACGGGGGGGAGGGGGGGGGGVQVLTGTLGDPSIAGLRYNTPTQAGFTGPSGEFLYVEGETVRFSFGGTHLGASPGRPEVTLLDLAGTGPIAEPRDVRRTHRDGSLSRLGRMAATLETFDRDGDAEVGIEITPELDALAEGTSIDLDRGIHLLRTDRPLRGLLNEANAAGLFPDHRALRSAGLAMNRLFDGEAPLFRIVRGSEDADANGVVDEVYSHGYDRRGYEVRRARDLDGNGQDDFVETFEIDDRGRWFRYARDTENDGFTDALLEFHHDADGDLVLQQQFDEQGQLVSDLRHEHDPFGNRTRTVYDEDGNGTDDLLQLLEYDERGNQIRISFDEDADGNEDFVSVFEYDERDLQLLEETDSDADGSPDRIMRYTWSPEGLLLRSELDSDGVDGPDEIEEFAYDADGRRVRTETDFDGNGSVDSILVEVYDESGNRIRKEQDTNADGTPERVERFERDADGNVVRYEYDRDNDGIPEEIELSFYDEHGNRIREEVIDPQTGMPRSIETTEHERVGWGSFFP